MTRKEFAFETPNIWLDTRGPNNRLIFCFGGGGGGLVFLVLVLLKLTCRHQ